MIRFRVFGSVSITRRDGTEVRSVLAQPKQTAVVAYLALGVRNGFHHRDKLVAVFWPDLDSDRARAALSKSVHQLRRELGEAVVMSRGDEGLALDGELFWCDALAFERLVGDDRLEEALAVYSGELLDGFHLSRAPDFERWVERERSRLREMACRACIGLADADLARGELTRAAHWAERALDISPYDEPALQRLVAALDRSGDRAGALRAYDGFAQRLASELEIEPSAETAALADAVRTRNTPRALPEPHIPALPALGAAARPAAARGGRRRAVARAAALVLLLGAVVGAALWRSSRPESSTLARADVATPRQQEARRLYRNALTHVQRWQQGAGNRERVRLAPIIVALLQDAIARDSSFVEAHVELAVQHLRIGWFGLDKSELPARLAWAALSKAMQLRPDAAEVHRGLGYYYYWADRNYARATQEFALVLRDRPDDAETLMLLGATLRREGRLEESVGRFERAVAVNPSALNAHSILCETYLGMRHYDEAEGCLLGLVAKQADRPYSHAYLMSLYVLWRGDLAKARAVMESAMKSIAPGELPENWANLCLLEHNYTCALDHLEPKLAAERESGRGITGQDDPYSVSAHLAAAWLHAKMGRTSEARTLYAYAAERVERAPGALPSIGGRHTWLSIAYAGLGRRDEAIREGMTAERLLRASNDLWSWPTNLELVTHAYVIAGAHDLALDRIEELLSLRYYLALSPALLRVDPRWDALRQHPRFQKLLAVR